MRIKYRYFVKSGTKTDCLMGVAKEKTEVGFLYYLWLKLAGFDVFKEAYTTQEG